MVEMGEEGAANTNNIDIALQFKIWLSKAKENLEIRKIQQRHKRHLQIKKTKKQIIKIQNQVKITSKNLLNWITHNPATDLVTDGVVFLQKNVQSMFMATESFVNQLTDPFMELFTGSSLAKKAKPEGYKPSQYHILLQEAKDGIYFDDEKWCLLISLIARRLEILLNRVLEIKEKPLNLFDLLETSQQSQLLDKAQLDVLHLFRSTRNDLLHGRTYELNPSIVFQTTEIIEDIEFYGRKQNLIS